MFFTDKQSTTKVKHFFSELKESNLIGFKQIQKAYSSVFIKIQAMSKLLSSCIEDGAVNVTSVKQFRVMLTSSGPNCFADVTLKVSHRVFVVVNQL